MPSPEPSKRRDPVLPSTEFAACPVRASLGGLGRKWALLVLRDVALLGDVTFGELLQRNTGLTPRALSMRLKDLRKEGLIERVEDERDARRVHYQLTRRGEDAVPIVTAFIQYGIRHHADRVFEDERPRELEQVFPGQQTFLLGKLNRYARAAPALEREGRRRS